MAASAIILHSSWRSASTYVWTKFRARPETYCYFEPLNETLATVTAETINRFIPWSFAHHPPLDAPYLEEFLARRGRRHSGISRRARLWALPRRPVERAA
jgi:hypothetical protein